MTINVKTSMVSTWRITGRRGVHAVRIDYLRVRLARRPLSLPHSPCLEGVERLIED